jgi:hypothetical protein
MAYNCMVFRGTACKDNAYWGRIFRIMHLRTVHLRAMYIRVAYLRTMHALVRYVSIMHVRIML